MNIVFRCDASNTIGTGHVRRCLTLATQLSQLKHTICFMSDISHEGHICDEIIDSGFDIVTPHIQNIPHETDWLIIDHYDIDAKWETLARARTKKIMVIDDIANRSHDCDILLDQNYYANMQTRYKDLVPSHAILLLGPQYALLRPEFKEGRNKRIREGNINNLLVNFGGKDPHQYTLRTLKHLEKSSYVIHVVMGSPDAEVQRLCDKHSNWYYHENVSNMAEIIAQCDLAIGAGGGSLWERASLGLPSVILSLADNQIELSLAADRNKLALYLGHGYDAINNLTSFLRGVHNDPYVYKDIIKNISHMFTQNGGDVITQMITNHFQLRPINETDCDDLFQWRNTEHVRQMMKSTEIIAYKTHVEWYKELTQDQHRRYFVFEINQVPYGVMNYTLIDEKHRIYEWGFYLGRKPPIKPSGKILCLLGLNKAFHEMGVKTIIASVKKENVKSLNIHKSLGFTEIEIENEYCYLRKRYDE